MSASSSCLKTPPLKLGRPPARASEGFLSTIAQGMWAEEVLRNALNEFPGLKAIKYGPSRWNHELIGSKEAWRRYVKNLYAQMSVYGKRPDLLVFREGDVPDEVVDISEEPEEEVMDIVKRSLAGIECRSSSYFFNQYREARKGSKYLSITVKDEDIARLNKWRETYCGKKKLFYVQIFFDTAWALSYDKILEIWRQAREKIEKRRKEYEERGIKRKSVSVKGDDYSFRFEEKTGKQTLFINVMIGMQCANAIETPELTCESITAWDGKVFAIRLPKGGRYKISEEFAQLLLSLSP